MTRKFTASELDKLGIVHRTPDILYWLNDRIDWTLGSHCAAIECSAGVNQPADADSARKYYYITDGRRSNFSYILTPSLEEASAALAALMWLGYPIGDLICTTKHTVSRVWSSRQGANYEYSKVAAQIASAFDEDHADICLETVNIQTVNDGDIILSSSSNPTWGYVICGTVDEAYMCFVQLALRGKHIETIAAIMVHELVNSVGKNVKETLFKKFYSRSMHCKTASAKYQAQYLTDVTGNGVIEIRNLKMSKDNVGYGEW